MGIGAQTRMASNNYFTKFQQALNLPLYNMYLLNY